MSNVGAAPRAAVPISNARAAASRRNGARSRGPKTPEGKARAAQNALKHGMRAHKYVLLPQEDATAFAALETTVLAELAPVGALQTLLARRVAVAAWRLERADRLEVEVLEFRSYEGANPGLALIRDGNATRSFDTLMRYRSAAMAEFWRALKTLKALQAESAGVPEQPTAAARALATPVVQLAAPAPVEAQPSRPAARRANAEPRGPNEPQRALLSEYIMTGQPGPGGLHEPAARWMPNEPESKGPARPSQAQISADLPLPAAMLKARQAQGACGVVPPEPPRRGSHRPGTR
jgi:hypothetical protein